MSPDAFSLVAPKTARAPVLCSLAMIVLVRTPDEASKLRRAIESTRGIADEVVLVIDDRSTPDAEAVGREFDAIMRRRKWSDSFSEARNAAAELCSGKWIVWLDADDYFVRPGALRRAMELDVSPDVITGDSLLENGEDGRPPQRLRRFVAHRRTPSIRWERRCHEELVGFRSRCDVGPIEIACCYRTRHAERLQRNARLLLLDDIEHPGSARNGGMLAAC